MLITQGIFSAGEIKKTVKEGEQWKPSRLGAGKPCAVMLSRSEGTEDNVLPICISEEMGGKKRKKNATR